MRTRLAGIAVAVALVVLPGSIAHAAQAGPNRSDPQTLINLERAWNRAFYQKDIEFLSNILADEFIATYEDGSLGDKTKELALTKAFDQRVDSSVQDDFVVKVYGDTAVVWFALHLTGPRQGVATRVDLRYVDVFVWRADRWQCVSSHSTKVAPKP